MYFSSANDLMSIPPVSGGVWNKDILREYLIWHSNSNFTQYIEDFFEMHLADEELLDLLFSFLLDDYYDGSDCQMGAARIIAKMDRQLLKRKKTLLLQAQENEVYWKRPFPNNEHLDWI